MKIAVFGAGYVGLVAGTCFADSGNDVFVVDVDEDRIEALREGRVPIYEPGLEELVRRNVQDGRLEFTTDGPAAVQRSRVIFIAVGTPMADGGRADLRHVLQVARTIGENLTGHAVVVDKSTVPVGTAEQVRVEISRYTDHEVDVVSNPEFMKEGAALEDFMKPDRVIIGTDSARAERILRDLYGPYVRTNKPILVMDVRSAELTKYAANAMLAARISFMNEMARLCEHLGANVESVRRGIGTDARIGFSFLFAGPGYGGSCFPKDLQALIHAGREVGCPLEVLEAVESVNERQKRRLVEKVAAWFGEDLSPFVIAVWGLAFKPNTDDMRQAPSLVVLEELLRRGARIRVSDPEAIENTRRLVGDRVEYCDGNYEAVEGADALVLVTEWNEYRNPDFERMKELMRQPVIFDGRNIWPRGSLEELGFQYQGIGL